MMERQSELKRDVASNIVKCALTCRRKTEDCKLMGGAYQEEPRSRIKPMGGAKDNNRAFPFQFQSTVDRWPKQVRT